MSATKDRFPAYVLCLVAAILFGLTVPASKVATRRRFTKRLDDESREMRACTLIGGSDARGVSSIRCLSRPMRRHRLPA